ncbi:hypothetical protein PoB_004314200 [Plakobranchus ocellatus]|uniref:Uncharacterized protein n=1 Tax=Plakobranchus ocellatus TaxID=259542 RepID=A0AAV4BCG2_9GAST|nr:hypothetical protein PoB_004314200 [Plakobranchus ocellatus]
MVGMKQSATAIPLNPEKLIERYRGEDAFSKQYFPKIKVPFKPSCGCFDFQKLGFYKWGDCDCNENLPFVCEKQKIGSACPHDWTELSSLNECVRDERVNATFDRAILLCENRGGIMLTIRNPQKYEAVRYILEEYVESSDLISPALESVLRTLSCNLTNKEGGSMPFIVVMAGHASDCVGSTSHAPVALS